MSFLAEAAAYAPAWQPFFFFSYAGCARESCGGGARLGGLGMTDGRRDRWSPPEEKPRSCRRAPSLQPSPPLGSTWHRANQDGAGRRLTTWLGPMPLF